MIAGGADRARREEMPGSKVTWAPRAPVPARANTGRWAGLSTWCGVWSEPACRGGGRARDARSRLIAPRPSLLPSAPRRRAHRPERAPADLGCRRAAAAVGGKELLAEAGRRCDAEACGVARGARARARGVRGTACAACAARRARAAARPAAAAEPRVAVDGPLHRSGRQARSARPT
jgi:hypothetical protein